MDSCHEWYDNDEDFKRYVDSYAKARELTVDVALTHIEVRNYLDYLIEKNKDVVESPVVIPTVEATYETVDCGCC